jgi:hypothetical protein
MKVSMTYETTDAFNLALGLHNGEYKPATSKEIRTWMQNTIDAEAEVLLDNFYAGRKVMSDEMKADVDV